MEINNLSRLQDIVIMDSNSCHQSVTSLSTPAREVRSDQSTNTSDKAEEHERSIGLSTNASRVDILSIMSIITVLISISCNATSANEHIVPCVSNPSMSVVAVNGAECDGVHLLQISISGFEEW